MVSRLGDLVCCELCPGVYHLECVGLSEVPEGDWVCKVCSQSQVVPLFYHLLLIGLFKDFFITFHYTWIPKSYFH